MSELVAGSDSVNWPEKRRAKAVATAPRMIEGRRPISGSTSRLIWASRRALHHDRRYDDSLEADRGDRGDD